MTLQNPNSSLMGTVYPQLTYTKTHTINGTYNLADLIDQIKDKFTESFDIYQHFRNGYAVLSDTNYGQSWRKIYMNREYIYAAGEDYRVVKISYNFFNPFNDTFNQDYFDSLFIDNAAPLEINLLNNEYYQDVFVLYVSLAPELDSIEDQVYKQVSELEDNLARVAALAAETSSSSGGVVKRYPPIPLGVNDPTANQTSQSYVVSGETYGNGTYVVSASSVLLSNAADHDISGIFNDGDVESYTGFKSFHFAYTQVSNQWLKVQLPTGIKLKKYVIVGRDIGDTLADDYITNCPRDWTVQGYNDAAQESTATKFDERYNEKFRKNCKKTFIVDQDEAFTYYKFNFIRNNGNWQYTVIHELILYGSE